MIHLCTTFYLLPYYGFHVGPPVPRYVRVNTLKLSTTEAISILKESHKDVRCSFHFTYYYFVVTT